MFKWNLRQHQQQQNSKIRSWIAAREHLYFPYQCHAMVCSVNVMSATAQLRFDNESFSYNYQTFLCVCSSRLLCLYNILLRQVGIGLGRRHIQIFMNNTYNELSTASRECLWSFHCHNQIYLVLSVSGFRYRSKTCVLYLYVRRKRILVKLETV